VRALLLLAALAGCDTPTINGTVYECESVFYCDGKAYSLTPGHGCAESTDEAVDLYWAHLWDIVKDAQCHDKSFLHPECSDTGRLCTK
jgi:hypothetical protein